MASVILTPEQIEALPEKDRTAYMMRQAHGWPRYPVLPVKRTPVATPDKVQHGTMMAERAYGPARPVVYLLTLAQLIHPRNKGKPMRDLPQIRYRDIDAVLADNWMVD